MYAHDSLSSSIAFYACLFLALVPTAILCLSKIRSRLSRWQRSGIVVLLIVTVLLNPIFQLPVFSTIDDHLNRKLVLQADAENLIGKEPASVKQVFGEPCEMRENQGAWITGEGSSSQQLHGPEVVWVYRAVPFFWFGNRFKVFFENGRVTAYNSRGN
jgi:hypothetical protein